MAMIRSDARPLTGRRPLTQSLVAVVTLLLLAATAMAEPSTLLRRLEERVRQNPDDAAAWRLLGRAREQADDDDGALEALTRSTELDPLSAAGQFDLGRQHLRAGDDQLAANCFAEALRLAPESSYGQQARELLQDLPEPETRIKLAAYEIRRFDRTDLVPGLKPPSERLNRSTEDEWTPPPPLAFRLEGGVLFNSNVALAPTSRELSSGNRSSFQAFLSPELEYALWNTPEWRAGPSLQGYANLNERHLDSLNLQSYRPGLFIEHLITLPQAILVPRAEYTYTHDAFGGDLFAQRHALALSNMVIWPNLNETTAYLVTDFTNYAADGADPAVTSSDGWTNTLGLNHRFLVEHRWLQSISAGVEGQRADTTGANFRYNSFGLLTDAEISLAPRLTLIADAGWSYRSYPDALVEPSRNENVWHAGARLRYDLTTNWSVAGVFTYDQFDSPNESFNTSRTILGVTTTFQY